MKVGGFVLAPKPKTPYIPCYVNRETHRKYRNIFITCYRKVVENYYRKHITTGKHVSVACRTSYVPLSTSPKPLSSQKNIIWASSACTFQCALARIMRKILFCLVTENVYGTNWFLAQWYPHIVYMKHHNHTTTYTLLNQTWFIWCFFQILLSVNIEIDLLLSRS